ncbi:MAG TPA: hypothetical protein VM657_13385 [Sphingomonas sp.]|nr:hypothetical protein [Sphingomonas sp.]
MPEDPPVHLTAEEARGGHIVLRKRRQRIVFTAGLVGMAIVAIAAWLIG